MTTLPVEAFSWGHFLSDLTVGQVIAAVVGMLTLVNAILTGAALRNARQVKRSMRRLIASVGLIPPEAEHRQGQTLTAQFRNLADQVERMQRAAQTQGKHDEPSVRPSRTHTPEAGDHRLRAEAESRRG